MASVARQKKAIILYDSKDMEDQWRVSPLFSSLVSLPSAQFLVSAHLKIHTFHLSDLLFAYMLGIWAQRHLSNPWLSPRLLQRLNPGFNALHWCITLTFFFSPVLSVASSLSPLFILSVCCSISSLSPPTNLSLSACLSPSFPHLVCIFTATTRLLSLPSISPIAVSPFFFFSCPSPFHLIHSPTLSPPPPAISPSHCGDWQESLALPQATCLRPHSSIHLLLPFFFLLLVCFMNDDHQTDAGEKSRSRGGRFGEQNSPFESEMCHHGNVC